MEDRFHSLHHTAEATRRQSSTSSPACSHMTDALRCEASEALRRYGSSFVKDRFTGWTDVYLSPRGAASGNIMARKRPDLLAVEQKRHLLISRSVIESSERPTAVLGWRPSGKSQISVSTLENG